MGQAGELSIWEVEYLGASCVEMYHMVYDDFILAIFI